MGKGTDHAGHVAAHALEYRAPDIKPVRRRGGLRDWLEILGLAILIWGFGSVLVFGMILAFFVHMF